MVNKLNRNLKHETFKHGTTNLPSIKELQLLNLAYFQHAFGYI